MSSDRRLSAGLRVRLAVGALLALLAAYAAQVATPLRLNTDSVVYLSMARSISTGHGVPAHADFPPGLPGLYALLDLSGIGRSWAIVLMNVSFLAVAVVATVFLYRRALGISREASVLLGSFALLSYVLVKHAPLAVSDVPFLGVATSALALLTVAAQSRRRRRFIVLGAGVALAIAATAIRTAGIALGPPVLVAALEAARAGAPFRSWLRTRTAGLFFVSCAAACGLAGAVLSSSRYFANASAGYGQTTVGAELAAHVRNWGEIGVNLPATRVPHLLHFVLLPAGVVVLAILLDGIWKGRHRLEPVHAFAVSYLVLILIWPYADARFWIPLVPLAIGYCYVALRPLVRRRAVLALVGAYTAVFVLIGLAALGYTTRISYSGARFPDLYGSDAGGVTLQPTYRVAFGEAEPGDAMHVNAGALAVLRHWEARARPH